MKKTKIKTEQKFPIVAVMGHVDHGKTTFLDAIRNSNIADNEEGGITQNTRVHNVKTKDGYRITFIDTPGHAAFTKMRERGSEVTDFVLLIVAVDDGIQPQTKESIEFALKNNVPIIVALNKIDIEGIDLTKIKKQLSSFGVLIEEYGGDVMAFPISAKNKTGLKELLEGIQLLAEVKELKSSEKPDKALAVAYVLESTLDKHLGNKTICILKSGNITNKAFGLYKDQIIKIRTLLDDEGKPLTNVEESMAFNLIGAKTELKAGELIQFYETEKIVLEKAKQYEDPSTKVIQEIETKESAEEMFERLLLGREEKSKGVEQKILNVIVKTSTLGTLEALESEINSLEDEFSKVNIQKISIGQITEDDIIMAKLTKSIVLSFQSDVPKAVLEKARKEKVLVRSYKIIYELVDEIAEALDAIGANFEEEIELGTALVKQVFSLSDGTNVAGSIIKDGKFLRGYRVKIIRDGEEIGKGKIVSLRHLKTEVKEIKKGEECGILLDPNPKDIAEGDTLLAFKVEKI